MEGQRGLQVEENVALMEGFGFIFEHIFQVEEEGLAEKGCHSQK